MKNDVVDICLQHGITYVDGYINADNKFNCICQCGRSWSTFIKTVKRGGRCGSCRGTSQKISQEAISTELSLLGLSLLQPYIGNKTPIVYECTCGGIGKTPINKLRSGSRCGNCAEYSWREKFQSRGCEILNYFSALEIIYSCHCGSIVGPTTANNWEVRGNYCDKCRIPWNHNPNAIYSRRGLYAWKREVLNRDNFECINCGVEENLHVHHIEAFSVRQDLASDINNGITCCKDCHTSLHVKYGINVGLKNLKLFLGDK
jgi:hypothetical protein